MSRVANAEGPRNAAETVRLEVDVPRSALVTVAPPAEYISQRTVEREFGIDARRYLGIIGEPGCTLEVIHVGKLRLVNRRAFIEYLRTRGSVSTRPTPSTDGLDALRGRLGLRKAGAR